MLSAENLIQERLFLKLGLPFPMAFSESVLCFAGKDRNLVVSTGPKVSSNTSDDHGIPAILYVLHDQIKSVGLKTDAHEILVIVGST